MKKTAIAIITVTALAFAVGSAHARKMHPSELSGLPWLASILGMIWIDDEL